MGKRNKHRHGVTATAPRLGHAGITTNPALTMPSRDPAYKWRLLAYAIIALSLLGGVWAYQASVRHTWPFSPPPEPEVRGKVVKPALDFNAAFAQQLKGKIPAQKPWQIPEWKARTDEELLIDRFVTLHKEGKSAAFNFLTELPADDGKPVSEAEFERRAANDFLRKKGVQVIDVWRGDPDRDGKPRPRPGRYVLVTRGNGLTPRMLVRDARGNESSSAVALHDPIIVVEVQKNKIQPLRTELNKRP